MSSSWSSPVCRLHIAIQELQTVAPMLQRLAFQLSGKVAALQLANNTAKAYLCNRYGTVLLFLSRLACIYSYTSKCGSHLLQGKLFPDWHFLPCIAQAAFQLWGQPQVDMLASSCTNQCQLYCTLEKPLPSGALGLNTFNHPYKLHMSYAFPLPALILLLLSKFLVENVTSHFRLLFMVAPC